jgi:hypothetical protein
MPDQPSQHFGYFFAVFSQSKGFLGIEESDSPSDFRLGNEFCAGPLRHEKKPYHFLIRISVVTFCDIAAHTDGSASHLVPQPEVPGQAPQFGQTVNFDRKLSGFLPYIQLPKITRTHRSESGLRMPRTSHLEPRTCPPCHTWLHAALSFFNGRTLSAVAMAAISPAMKRAVIGVPS